MTGTDFMVSAMTPGPESSGALHAWSEDLRALGWLHSAERDFKALVAIHHHGFPDGLALPAHERSEIDTMHHALAAIVLGCIEEEDLAADYAAIYLTHALRVSPCESVWRDEDHLMLQAPTFAVRAFFRRHGLAAANWRAMPDDHLALELEFLAVLLDRGETAEALHFLDKHLMMWLPGFGAAVGARAATAFYRALAQLTVAYCESLHGMLRAIAESGTGTDVPD